MRLSLVRTGVSGCSPVIGLVGVSGELAAYVTGLRS